MIKIRNNKNFKGNIKEFIALCERWLNTFVIGKKGFVPNERLVRGYVTEEILPRPDRKGKESIYEYKHLIYFLVCRDLFSENWPLAKIGEHLRSISFKELELNFLKKYNQISVNDSLEVIGELKKSSQTKIKENNLNVINENYTNTLMSRSYQNSQQTIKEFESDLPNVLKDEFTTFTLASWLSLAIKTRKLSEMNSNLAFRISNAVKAALIDTNLQENTFAFEGIKKIADIDLKNKQLEREILTLKKDNSSLQNKLLNNEHEKHLRDLEADKIEELYYKKEEKLKQELAIQQNQYLSILKEFEEKQLFTIKNIELDNKKQMEELQRKYEIQIKEQQSKIDDYEARLSELEKQITIKK
ncbi:hypothetical protein N9W47_03745 [Alphaproteobacteria bacterium]|nr:hypothetical protein [Alphaproteobacteria bacterium]